MYRFIALVIGLVATMTASLALASTNSSVPSDPYPGSCDGKAVSFHLKRAKALIDTGYDKSRWRDKTPLKRSEKVALKQHKFCIQIDNVRDHIEKYRKEASEAFKKYRKRKLKPEWPTPESVGVSKSTLDQIASCESHHQSIDDSSGTYHGLFQFDIGTWGSVGGSGDPHVASEEEQYYRAALLYRKAGPTPWPVCGV
jgi:hypothetical protein